jgi:hypothetical protein
VQENLSLTQPAGGVAGPTKNYTCRTVAINQ